MKILIAEDIPSHNKGEEALFLGLVESLKTLGDTEIYLLSLNPQVDAENYKTMARIIDARGITPAHILDSIGTLWEKSLNMLTFFFKYFSFAFLYLFLRGKSTKIMTNPVWQLYCDVDLVLLGHDSFFSPRYHGALALFCRIINKPAVFYAGTTENPIFHQTGGCARFYQWMIRFCLKMLPLILLREEISRNNLKKIGLDSNSTSIAVHTDLAFLVEPINKDEACGLLEKEGIPRNRPIIGMTMTQRKLHFAYRHLPMQERINKSMAALTAAIDYMVDELGATVVFIPHSIGPSKLLDDRIIAETLKQSARHPEHIFNIHTEYSVRQLKGIAGEFDMTVGARLHFVIDAICQYVPSLLITHIGDTRCHGIVGDMVGMKKWLYNIDMANSDTLIQLIKSLWNSRSEVRRELEGRIPALKQDTYMHGEMTKKLLSS